LPLYAKEHLPLPRSFQRAFAVTSLFPKSICRYLALSKEHLPLPRSLQRAFAVTSLFAKSICRYLALSHNGNALFIALGVGLIELNQPKSLNSLSDALFNDLIHASIAFDSMDEIGAIVVTGKGKAFAAGADIPEMITKDFAHAYNTNMFSQWADICKISKPIINCCSKRVRFRWRMK
jgi:hypothetical protein